MIQGTTPIHIFELPFDVSAIKKVKIIYSQNDEIIIQKDLLDCTLNENKVTVELTQEDTFKFDADYLVDIQIRILTTGGDALASIPQTVGVIECLDKEVLV